MRLLHVLLLSTVVLLGHSNTSSAVTDVKMSGTTPFNLRGNSLLESVDRYITKRSLRQKTKAIDDDNAPNQDPYEERTIIDLETVSSTTLKVLMSTNFTQKRTFKYLDNQNITAWQAYVRLGGPDKLIRDSTREKFWKAYGNYLQAKYPDVAR
ncbi:RxLR effector protein [Phytophthora megakarya]|uniref:RxLR effector protein n=1 Tax=Phytophthora megakarya TaxID=4795 RepID=A0A225WFV5_9STRA|nr:RxLR effector protein [Phytophthora megakarya]